MSPSAEATQRQRTVRYRLLTLLGLLSVLLLTACGAVVDTTLTVNADGSGVRAMTATISAADLETVPGGVAAIESAINANRPEGLDYGGATTNGQGATVLAFSVTFANAAEYTTKVQSILGAGDQLEEDTRIELVVADSVFRTGTSVKENFTSQQLLAWLVKALVAAGTVKDSDKGNASAAGTTAVSLGGVAHQTSAQIGYSNIADHGVRKLTVSTEGAGTGKLTRTIAYDLSRETYSTDPEGFDAFFKKAVPEGGSLAEPDATGSVWTIRFTAKDAAGIISGTNQALAANGTLFAVERSIDAEGDGAVHTSVIDRFDCSAICAEDAEVLSLLSMPKGTSAQSGGVSAAEGGKWTMPQTADPVEFRYTVPFKAVRIDVYPSVGGENRITIDYTIAEEYAKLFGKELRSVVDPGKHGAVEQGKDGKDATLRVTFTAPTAAGLQQKLETYLPGARVGATSLRGDLFGEDAALSFLLDGSQPRLAGEVTQGIGYAVHAPLFAGIAADRSRLPEGAEVRDGAVVATRKGASAMQFGVQVRTINLTSIAVAAFLGLAVIGGIVVILIRQRRRAAAREGVALATPRPVVAREGQVPPGPAVSAEQPGPDGAAWSTDPDQASPMRRAEIPRVNDVGSSDADEGRLSRVEDPAEAEEGVDGEPGEPADSPR